MNYALNAENIFHSFAEHQVLNGININVKKGEIFGLLGPSGSGKTTLIKILTGQLAQSRGRAEIFGKDAGKLTPAERKKIGVMMDDWGLYGRLSVYDNMKFYTDIYRISPSCIDGILKDIGLYEARKTAVSKLSKGMKNRLSLARAMINNAEIIFLDEPTSALDPVTTKEIHKILVKAKEAGKTIFLTTHNMFEAESICGRIALLSKGNIIEHGSPAEICRKYDRLKKLTITLKDGETVFMENGKASAEAVADYLEKDMIGAIHSTEPTLEAVFIELTGKGLEQS
ncbi:MAG: ABC transporter ATP-binding protein [Ruminococcus sp.]|nr:ABC transporter ATP-binding protein [Ruminococcus sp.]